MRIQTKGPPKNRSHRILNNWFGLMVLVLCGFFELFPESVLAGSLTTNLTLSSSSIPAGNSVNVTIIWADSNNTYQDEFFTLATESSTNTTIQSCGTANQYFLLDSTTPRPGTTIQNAPQAPFTTTYADTNPTGGWDSNTQTTVLGTPVTQVVTVEIPASLTPGNYNLVVVMGENYMNMCPVGTNSMTTSYVSFNIPGGNTSTPTPTGTNTLTRTITLTPTITGTNTKTPATSFTPTLTPTITLTLTNTVTLTPTITNTNTLTPTKTSTFTQTPTLTITPTITLTNTPTRTPLLTFTITLTPTITVTQTNTSLLTATPTNTLQCGTYSGAGTPAMLNLQVQCQQQGTNAQSAHYDVKVTNYGSSAVSITDICFVLWAYGPGGCSAASFADPYTKWGEEPERSITQEEFHK